MLYELISTMPELRLLPLIERFAAMLAELPVFADTVKSLPNPTPISRPIATLWRSTIEVERLAFS
jgi:hypothetical protein